MSGEGGSGCARSLEVLIEGRCGVMQASAPLLVWSRTSASITSTCTSEGEAAFE